MKRSFLEALDERVLVCDGAMGTMLYARGVFINRSFDALNLAQPELVGEVHREYLRAGADVIETNTFGANRVKLAAFGLSDRLHEINRTGAEIARGAARGRGWVAGAIGPLGIRIEPFGRTGVDEAETYFKEQAAALLEGGVDLFILETFRDVNEIGAAIAAVRSLTDLPIVAQMTTEEDGNSLDGTPPEEFGPALDARGATLIGVNCSVGPAPMLETIERLERATSRKLSAQPNAGRPRDIEGRNIYLCSPEYMASYARRFIQRGVRLVGGCCGTTPEHIRQIRLAVQAQAPSASAGRRVGRGARPLTPRSRRFRAREKSPLARALAEGRPVVTVELEPPRGVDASEVLAQAARLAALGVDALTVSEGAKGSARMSALSLAVLLKQAGLRARAAVPVSRPLPAGHAVGSAGRARHRHPQRAAGHRRPAQAGRLLRRDAGVRRGLDWPGQRRRRGSTAAETSAASQSARPTAFHVGVVGNPTAPRLDDEVRRFEYKAEAGAEFAITLPIFDLDALDAFLEKTAHVRVPILAAVRPFDSLLHAEFLANEVPNLRVPEALLARMREADGQGRAAEEGLAIAIEIADAVRRRVQGLQVGGPPEAIAAVLAGLPGRL